MRLCVPEIASHVCEPWLNMASQEYISEALTRKN